MQAADGITEDVQLEGAEHWKKAITQHRYHHFGMLALADTIILACRDTHACAGGYHHSGM